MLPIDDPITSIELPASNTIQAGVYSHIWTQLHRAWQLHRKSDCGCCRLQPSAVVTDEQCAACDFNKPGKTCLRPMEWVWRGENYSATSAEYNSIKAQLASESFPALVPGGPVR